MAEEGTIQNSSYSQLSQQVTSNYYLFFLGSRQAMMAGYYVVVAVHFSTCYWLISQGGFLTTIAFAVLMVNAGLGVLFSLWDRNYQWRLDQVNNLKTANSEKNTAENYLPVHLALQKASKPGRWLRRANQILIISVSLASVLAACGLFIKFTLPHLI